MANVRLTDVKKIYQGNVVAVHNFNLDIKDQEFVVFVGPSGCGKSTTLRMIAGLEEISEGTVEIDGQIVNDLQPKDRSISMVFQNYALYPHLTVFDNIAFPLRLSKQKKLVDLTDEEIKKDEALKNNLEKKITALETKISNKMIREKREQSLKKLSNDKTDIENRISAMLSPVEQEKIEKLPEVMKIKEVINSLNEEKNSLNVLLAKEDNDKKAAKLRLKIKKIDSQLEKLEAKRIKLGKSKDILVLEKFLKKIENDILSASLNTEDEGKLAILKEDLETVNAELTLGKKAVYQRMSSADIFNKVKEVAEILGITDYLARKPKALSGGQRQRVAIGRAMVKDCKVLLMDEPLSNLDAKLRNQMRAEIILLRKKIKTTFIYVTHDQTEAMTLGDRIVIMKDGLIMQVGTPKEVFDTPSNLFVAEFIGAPKMNTFKSSLYKDGDKYFVHAFESKIEIDDAKAAKFAANNIESKEIILGVRPEHILLGKKDDKHSFKVTIQVDEMMGSEVHLHALTDDGTPLIVRIPTIQLSPEEMDSLVYGKELYITFDSKVMHFFDTETHESLLK